MTPLASYRRLLSIAGPTYVLVAFVGRLPLAMSQLGTLLLVSTATGSYGLGGLSAGALAVANAVGAPIAGSLADRVGQRPVVLVQSLLGATGLATLVAVVGSGSTDAAIVLSAAATGLVLPQVGPLARVRWRPLTRSTGTQQRRLVDAAFSYEGAADEASFAIGPALVGLSVALVSPSGALLLAAVFVWVVWSAIGRFREPVEVKGGLMFAVAVGGLAANLVGLWLLKDAKDKSLNLRGAYLEVLGDALGSSLGAATPHVGAAAWPSTPVGVSGSHANVATPSMGCPSDDTSW